MEFTRRMSFALLGGVCLRGAEVWTKDPASWDEKDIARLLSDSPWAQKVQVSPGGGGMGGAGGGMGGPGGGMGGAGGGIGGGDDPTGQLSGPGGGPGGGMGGGGRRGGGGMGGGGGMQPMTFTVRWMSALPLKQAILRSRMGKEADTSPQAKEYLERQESHYAVALIGPPRGGAMGGGMAGGAGAGPGGAQQDRMQRMNEHLKEATGLLRKGKPPIRPETVQIPQPGQNSYLFLFPRADAITLDDKEVEFATRLGPLEVKRKFKLKDMVYNGQLAL